MELTMEIRCRRIERGFTLIEIMIVVAIIGILAGIAIPNFLNLKDKALWGTAKANLMVMRSALSAYATDSTLNKYPLGSFNFFQFSAAVPQANLPGTEDQSKFQNGSFSYSCSDGAFYTINVNVNNRAFDALIASPEGISPDTYDSYVR
jgi:prepilin-type N-terminal cleavage/methylation domain-containing protein